jgi:murein DD-endopeptidase MepM/ murein hydrolase activator NlpD
VRSCGDRSTYTVVTDDSWFLIAKKSSTSMGAVLEANGATERTALHPGDTICLPKQAVVAASPASGVLRALPVQGPCWYSDTWHAPRGGARRHEGVDLMAKQGQYVYAVTDGVLSARAWDQPGTRAGNAWWLTAADGTYYFYAHLSDFAPDLKVGSKVVAGQIIGFVGSTGNAAGSHLHFEIHPKGGPAINPYPIVKAAGGCKKD